MSFGDISNTGLRLGLGLGLGVGLHDRSENCMKIDDQRMRESQKKKEDVPSKCNNNKAYPSLTLGPIIDDDEANDQPASKIEASSPSAVSSFSNSSSFKKERDQFLGEEFEIEVEKVPSRVHDVDEDSNPRKKLRLTKEQSAVLEESFKEHSTLNPVP